jgi:hypothetical protein
MDRRTSGRGVHSRIRSGLSVLVPVLLSIVKVTDLDVSVHQCERLRYCVVQPQGAGGT